MTYHDWSVKMSVPIGYREMRVAGGPVSAVDVMIITLSTEYKAKSVRRVI